MNRNEQRGVAVLQTHFGRVREMNAMQSVPNAVIDPLQALLASPDDAVLAVISSIEGPSYRPIGAMMAIFPDDRRVGTLSSGCIEADIVLHAQEVRETETPKQVRYGRGSNFIDIQLPCGGGLDILLLPRPDLDFLQRLATNRETREAGTLEINCDTGAMRLLDGKTTQRRGNILEVHFEPDIQFLIIGKGPEASDFASLVHSIGYSNLLLSPDPETLDAATAKGCPTQFMTNKSFPENVNVDQWTAIVLFFHDHEWEPPILSAALLTNAFYIGAQGSQRARDQRLVELESLGVDTAQLCRLHGPIGLIPSARDSATLAVSVLAEIMAKAMQSK